MTPLPQPPEQLRYARWLAWGMRAGLALLLAALAALALGLAPPQPAPERQAALWQLPLADYLRASGAPTGWGWLGLLPRSDMAALAGIALLAGCSVPALLALLPLLLRRGERLLALICLADAAVILLAASGWLARGP